MASVCAPSLPTTATTSHVRPPLPPSLPTYGITPPDSRTLTHVSNQWPCSGPSTARSPSVPLLPPHEFARMHLEHVTAHPPDSVLFPFLHGLEGDNEAQSMFFVAPTEKALAIQNSTGMLQDPSGRILRPPRYRGLVWVLCDDDLEDSAVHCVDGWRNDSEFDIDSDEFSSEDGEGKGDTDVEMNPENGDPHPRDPDAMDVDSTTHSHNHHTHPNPSHGNYMHPLALRISTADHDTTTKTSVPFPGAPLNVAFTTTATSPNTNHTPHSQGHDRRPSNASSIESSSTYDSSSVSNSSSGSTSVTSLPSPPSPSCPGGTFDITDSQDSGTVFENGTGTTTTQTRSRPPFLTCSFLPSQLIQPRSPLRAYDFNGWKVDVYGEDIGGVDLDWELKPAKVPEGISLRNFGIQVPLYTSVSDIVIYSPKGASPAALRLAERFRKAIDRKRRERLDRWAQRGLSRLGYLSGDDDRTFGSGCGTGVDGRVGGSDAVEMEAKASEEGEEDPYSTTDGFLKYGVYVLDADADQIEKELPWMVMRKEGECKGGCEQTQGAGEGKGAGCCEVGCAEGLCCALETHGLTEGTDGRLVCEAEMDSEVGVRGQVQVQRHPQEERVHGQHLHRTDDAHRHHSSVHPPHAHHHRHPHGYGHCQHSHSPYNNPANPALNLNPDMRRLHRCRRANTIDFAQREKDEMRDLTRASEIVSVFGIGADTNGEGNHAAASGSTTATYWNPYVGQVFLGNSTDVPLWTPPSKRKGLLDHGRSASAHPTPDHSISPSCQASPSDQEFSSDTDPIIDPFTSQHCENPSSSDSSTNDPSHGLGFDICIECHEFAPLPSAAHLRAAEEHVRALELEWVERWRRHWEQQKWQHEQALSASSPSPQSQSQSQSPSPAHSPSDTHSNPTSNGPAPIRMIPPRPPPHPSAIIHLPFPSSPQGTQAGLNSLMPVIRFLERVVTPGGLGCLMGVGLGSDTGVGAAADMNGNETPSTPSKVPVLPSPWSPTPGSATRSRSRSDALHRPSNANGNAINGYPNHCESDTNGHGATRPPPSYRPRPLKVLLYSSDGYTESSVPALCLLMALKGLSLPEVYLEMQVAKHRSFFVYQSEVGLLRKVEARLGVGNGSFRSRYPTFGYRDIPRGLAGMPARKVTQPMVVPSQKPSSGGQGGLRTLTLSIPSSSSAPNATSSAVSCTLGSSTALPNGFGAGGIVKRPRASTLPTFISDHHSWFDDARFDGSFPSRVLPFLYLGNLNHASNAYMLHALGITHVVSVGECALVPPPQTPTSPSPLQCSPSQRCSAAPSPSAQFVAGQGPGGQGSLWIEEREGRIKVLDIKGVCDDGIDTLEPQLHPICTWIEKARLAGGQVLVHCRVGVSRSATVTIAYVMQYLGLSLVEAYLLVRSRRLSVLIQPNMRLLYNLLGWEVRLARERAGTDEKKLREELGRALSWPYLAREVHALNEKYLS
ncbi:hypothetical protein PAXRUDRAFT_827227 [Paxillus rubicundulus Ve08.2h10]|uniref:Unplaced genomic scaffold scaffold_234, whole genome shotgun sequence n=1 Tax=Paxillus rubicundulus Ve08.2h10 TaxID=930991 RepID=A0A0D0E8T9_9AGAM|nr:hypothetical protein PAXRUDRAFT_827227 [Paxillus rubicundulus Ve08.2h10]